MCRYGIGFLLSLIFSLCGNPPRTSTLHLSTFRAELDALRANFHSSTDKPVVFCPSD